MVDETLEHVTTLDFTRFRAWLQDKPIGEIVGIRCSFHRCPLANFLRFNGVNYPVVQPHVYVSGASYIGGPYHRHTPTPDWAKSFMRNTDIGTMGGMAVDPTITAGRALEVITGLEAAGLTT